MVGVRQEKIRGSGQENKQTRVDVFKRSCKCSCFMAVVKVEVLL